VNALSKVTGHDRRTLDKMLADVTPVKVEGRTKFFTVEQVQEKLSAKPDKSLKEAKLTEEIRKLRIRNDRDDRKLVFRSDEIARAQKFATWQRDYLTQKLTKEYPSAVAGLDVAGAMAYGRRVVVAICESTQQMIKELSTA
jgi:hypothetical protein